MKKFLAVVLLLTGLVLGVFAYACYSESSEDSRVARFFQTHPDEVPVSGKPREELIAASLLTAGRERNLAILIGAASLLFCVAGAALFFRRRREQPSTAPYDEPAEDPVRRAEVVDLWASVALERSIEVHYRREIALGFVLAFLIGTGVLAAALYGFTETIGVTLALNVSVIAMLYYSVGRMLKKSVKVFDRSGIMRRDHRRLSWAEFQGVNYITEVIRTAIKPGTQVKYVIRTEERLLRIELLFESDKALLIPQRIKNLEEIANLVDAMPGVHLKRGKRI